MGKMKHLNMMTPKELSELTSINVRTILHLAQNGHIPSIKVGRQWRFVKADIEKWIRETATHTHHRILVVDDDEHIVQLVEAIASRLGHEVVTTTKGKQAINILKEGTDFSLVVLDLMMKQVSGVDVLKWMKRNKVEIAIIIFTGFPDSEMMNEALKYELFTVLRKPVVPEKIKQAIIMVLGGVEKLKSA